MKPDTDPVDLDDTVPLTRQEVLNVRRLLRDHAHMSWLGRKLRFLVLPMLIAIAGLAWQLVEWFSQHVKVTP